MTQGDCSLAIISDQFVKMKINLKLKFFYLFEFEDFEVKNKNHLRLFHKNLYLVFKKTENFRRETF